MSVRLGIAIFLGLALALEGALFVFSGESPALASTSRDARAELGDSMDLRPVPAPARPLEASVNDARIEGVLRDSDNRVGADFRVPTEMRGLVGFWLRIYAEYTSEQFVIFDSRHPDVVYDVLDFRELARTSRNRAAYEIVSKNRIRAAISAYRAAFARLARDSGPKNPTREEKRILTALRRGSHAHSFATYARSLRVQAGQRDHLLRGMTAAEVLFPKMEALFDQMGVPVELTRLCLVESSFDYRATSRLGAAGIWQFMPGMTQGFLKLDPSRHVDERLSPLKATAAAGKLLMLNRQLLGNWPLAIVAYNHGTRHLLRLRSRDFSFARIAHLFSGCSGKRNPLGWASRNYFGEFLAVVHAEAYRDLLFGEGPGRAVRPLRYVRMGAGMTSGKVAAQARLTLAEFRALNPDLRGGDVPLPEGFLVALPSEVDDLSLLAREFSYQSRGRRKTSSL